MEYKKIKTRDNKETYFYFLKEFIPNQECKEIIKWLDSMDDFIKSEGLESNISRYQKWYQKDRKYFCNKWRKKFDKWESFIYDNMLLDFQESIISRIKNLGLNNLGIDIPNINSCLINKYRDRNDHIKYHRDTHLTFGRYPTIINISFGTSRILSFKEKGDFEKKSKPKYNFNLENGSLFIMSGSSQEDFYHGIDRSNKDGVRYSLTFREVL